MSPRPRSTVRGNGLVTELDTGMSPGVYCGHARQNGGYRVKSYRQFLIDCSRTMTIRAQVSKLPVVYDPQRANNRFPWVDENGQRYECRHVEAVNPKTNRRYNP